MNDRSISFVHYKITDIFIYVYAYSLLKRCEMYRRNRWKKKKYIWSSNETSRNFWINIFNWILYTRSKFRRTDRNYPSCMHTFCINQQEFLFFQRFASRISNDTILARPSKRKMGIKMGNGNFIFVISRLFSSRDFIIDIEKWIFIRFHSPSDELILNSRDIFPVC